MRIPFYHRDGHGLAIGRQRVRWAVLRLSRRRGAAPEVRRVLSEPADDEGGIEGAVRRLVERVRPSPPVVATHLDPDHVRFFAVEVPRQRRRDSPSPSDEERALIREEVARQLPGGADLDRFHVCSRVLPKKRTTDRGRVGSYQEGGVGARRRLVAIARREAVRERVELLSRAGLVPAILGDARADLGYAFAFDEDFTKGPAQALLFHSAQAWILPHAAGELARRPRLAGDAAPEAAFEEAAFAAAEEREGGSDARPAGAPGPPALLVAGEEAERAFSSSKRQGDEAMEGPAGAARRGIPSLPAPSEEPLGPADALAVALAVKQLLGRGDTLTFLSEEQEREARQAVEKVDGVRVMLAAGGTFVAVLALITALSSLLSWQLEKNHAALRDLGTKTETIKEQRERLGDLRARLEASRRLVEKRTRAASLLEDIGRAVPQGVWLRGVNTLPEEKGRSEAFVSGFALKEEGVTTFLAGLEKADRIKDVRLALSGVTPLSQVLEDIPEEARPPGASRVETLSHFNIEMKWVRR